MGFELIVDGVSMGKFPDHEKKKINNLILLKGVEFRHVYLPERKAESGKRKAESGKRKAESGKRKAESETAMPLCLTGLIGSQLPKVNLVGGDMKEYLIVFFVFAMFSVVALVDRPEDHSFAGELTNPTVVTDIPSAGFPPFYHGLVCDPKKVSVCTESPVDKFVENLLKTR